MSDGRVGEVKGAFRILALWAAVPFPLADCGILEAVTEEERGLG